MLKDLRKEIDAIDEQLISLFKQRMKVVKRVGVLKKKDDIKFFIRSAREADMIKNLLKKSGKNLPKSLLNENLILKNITYSQSRTIF